MSVTAGRHQTWPAYAVAISAVLAPAIPSSAVAQSKDSQNQIGLSQIKVVRREAPVFTYRQITSQLPAPLALPDDEQPVKAISLRLPAQSVPEGHGQAGIMGRFGETVDPVSARNGLSAVSSKQSETDPGAPRETSVIKVGLRPPSQRVGQFTQIGKSRLIGSGWASWYQRPGLTANGERYNPDKLTAAHKDLPFGTQVRVVNKHNGRSVVVRITDRTGRNLKGKRIYAINLSRAGAQKLGIVGIGIVALYKTR